MSILLGNLYPGGTTTMGLSTADNGLTANTATNVELGGTLIKNTTINPAAFQLLLGNLGITASEVTVSSAPVNPTDVVRLQDITALVASYKNPIAATTTIFNFNAATTASLYRLSYAASIDTFVGGYTVTYQITCALENGGALSYNITDNSTNRTDAILFYAGASGVIFFEVIITGTVTMHVAATLEFLK